MDELPDRELLIELCRAIDHGSKRDAFDALERLFRDHDRADTIAHWIGCAKSPA